MSRRPAGNGTNEDDALEDDALEDDALEEDAPWYEEGLQFRCTACGECCTGVPGYVWITKDDVRRLAEALGLSVRVFKRRYVRRAKGKVSLRERANGDCILLKGEHCSAYDAKPIRCSTFPFWSEVLSHPSEWEITGKRCEGIGRGDLYPLGDIRRLLDGDPEPLLRRHAGPPAEQEDRPPGPDWEGAFAALERLYAELERDLPRYGFTCSASGRCCDFDTHGHRLYVTALEAEHFFRNGPRDPDNGDPRLCPAYGTDKLCHARDARMLGCRAYFCGPYPVAPPDDLYERYHHRLKRLHERFDLPFAYRDLVDWVKERRARS